MENTIQVSDFHARISVEDLARKMKNKGVAQNPTVPGAADYIMGGRYDRYTLAQGANLPSEITFFTVPVNQQGKTYVDTNMVQAGQLPAPEWLNVTAIEFYFADTMTKEDISRIINNSWAEFTVGEKIYSRFPLWKYPASGGIYAASQFYSSSTGYTAAPQRETVYNNGVPVVGNVFDLRLPGNIQIGVGDSGPIVTDGVTGVVIPSGQQFRVSVKFGSVQTLGPADGLYGGALITCVLSGMESRPVQ